MYQDSNMLASIRKVEAAREENAKLDPRRMTADEKDALLKKFHPDYRTEQFTELRFGPNQGQKVPLELAELLEEQGIELEAAMKSFLAFAADNVLVCHNAAFDYRFIQAACRKCALPAFQNKCIDTLAMARKKLRDIQDYKLQTLAAFFSLEIKAVHRALDDCYLGYGIYEKLKEI